MFEKKHDPKVIRSAHEKQKLKARGQGGVIFTEAEQKVLDEHVRLEEADEKETT